MTVESNNLGPNRSRSLLLGVAAAMLATACRGPEAEDTGYEVPIECSDDPQRAFYVWQNDGIYGDMENLMYVADQLDMTHGRTTTDPDNILWVLENFREAGLRVLFRLTSWDECATDDKRFDFEGCKAEIEAYESVAPELELFLEDGTLAGVVPWDDAGNFEEGAGPSSFELDEIARIYEDSLRPYDGYEFPEGFTNGFRGPATDVRDYYDSYDFEYLNGVFIQLSGPKVEGDPRHFIRTQMDAAAEVGLPIISVDVNGPDYNEKGPDGCPGGRDGWLEDRCPVTVEQLADLGDVMSDLCVDESGLWTIDDEEWAVFYEEDDYAAGFRGLGAPAEEGS